MKLDKKQDLNVLYQVCDFFGQSVKQDGRIGLWLAETFLTSPLKPLNGILTKFDSKQDLNVLYQVCVFRADWKHKMAALASDWPIHFSTSPLKPLNGIQRNWTGSKISMSSTKFVFFGLIGNTRRPPWPLIGRYIFRLLLWNRWTEFNETGQEARSQCHLQSLCFLGQLEKQDGRPGLWLAETFSTFPLKRLNRIQWNLTRSKISPSTTKFLFFWPTSKQKWPPWPIPQKGGTLYLGAGYVALCASCYQNCGKWFGQKLWGTY